MSNFMQTAAMAAVIGALTATAASADCAKTVDEARAALKQAEAAVSQAKESGKKAAAGPLGKAKKGLLHAEAECKEKDIRKQAEGTREAREAQGYAEEARMLAEKL
jgi:hypothetical protein